MTIWLSGFGFAALFVFPGAMMADVIDDDAARSGQQRAAIYYGMFKTLEKMAQGGAAVLVGLLIQIFGGTQTALLDCSSCCRSPASARSRAAWR